MKIVEYKGFEFSEIKVSELSPNFRIDSEHYMPIYLRQYSNVTKNAHTNLLSCLKSSIIHPTEIKREYEEEGVIFLRTQNVRPMQLDFSTSKVYISEVDASILERNSLEKWDVLTTRTGANFGQTAIFSGDETIIASSHVLILRANEKINKFFLLTFLNCVYGRGLIDKGMYGGLQPEIAPSYLNTIPVPIPSVLFQKRIESIVLNAFEYSNLTTSSRSYAENIINEKLKINLSHSDIQISEIYSTRIFQDDRIDAEYWQPYVLEIIEKIKSVEYAPLHKFTTISGGFAWKSEFFGEKGEGLPFVRIRDCKPTYIDNENLTTLAPEYVKTLDVPQAQKGDIVVGMDGLKYFYGSLIIEPVYVNQRVCHLKVLEHSELEPEYLVFIINSKIGQTQLLRQMTIADTVGHITNVDVHNLLIPLFDKETRAKITESVKKSIEAEINAKKLIKLAKQAVEIYVEQDEKSALKYIEKGLETV